MPEDAGSRDVRTDNIKEEVGGRILFLFTLYVPVLTCMHFVCALYASPTAYIYSLSALRTRLFAFLYALYAVFFGVMFSHSMHSRFFDAYNAYKSHGMAIRHDCQAWWQSELKERAMRRDGSVHA